MTTKNKARYGRVIIQHSYVVDLTNETMVEEAKDCLYEDIMNAVKFDELYEWIDVIVDKTAKKKDIADFLKEE